MSKIVQTKDLVIGKRYYLDAELDVNGIYEGKSKTDGIIFSDIEDNNLYIVDEDGKIGFTDIDYGYTEF